MIENEAEEDFLTKEDILPLRIIVERHIRKAISACSGNYTQAADALGIDRRTLIRRMEKYEKQCRIVHQLGSGRI